MGDLIRYRLLGALLLIFSGAALNARDFELVCDPGDFRLEPDECFSVPVDSDAGNIWIGLSIDFPRKALVAANARAILTFINEGGRELCRTVLSVGEDPSLAGFQERALRLNVDSITASGERITVLDFYATKGVRPSGGVNSLVTEYGDGKLSFQIGGDRLNRAGVFEAGGHVGSIRLQVTKAMDVKRFCVKQSPDYSKTLMTRWSSDSLASYFADSTDSVEGFWSFLDRDNDPAWAIPGGFYDLAVVRGEGQTYDIIYLSGAKVDASRWREGMRKGKLSPTIFADHYILEWTDSRFMSDYEEITADISAEGTILTLNFPIYHSKLRFSKRSLAK